MSWWTYINGTITVSPMGRTQEEKEYILKTILKHLPNVTGSENDMYIKVIEKESGCTSSSSHDEFGMRTDNLIDRYGQRSYHRGWLETNEHYIIIVYGSFRDRVFNETYKEFIKWITRLAKRIDIVDVLVKVDGYDRSEIIANKEIKGFKTQFGQMFEYPSWANDTGEPTWCEYLMWDRAKNSMLPNKLQYKYFADEENDKVVEMLMERG